MKNPPYIPKWRGDASYKAAPNCDSVSCKIRMKRILIFFVRVYRKYISPIKGRAACRYIPTCSQYAIEALEKYGALKGSYLAKWFQDSTNLC